MLTPEQFAAVREYLRDCGFTEETLRQRLKIPPEKPLDLVSMATKPSPGRGIADGLDVLLRLLVLGEAMAVSEAKRHFRPAVWEALTQSELILEEGKEGGQCLASVALFPVRGLFLAADRWTNVDHSLRPTFDDIVYPVMTKSGKQYLEFVSFEPCEDFLEMCAGTAPAALLAGRVAKRVWAADITGRSLAFARFNAALNGIANVEFVQGDLFQPVDGRVFDRIAAHPPYMPVLKPAEIYSAGGVLGDEISRRIVADLPGRLKPGGRFYCRTLGVDRAERTFEQQVRHWLGEKQSEYDVALFVFDTLQPRRFALEHTLNKDGGRAEVAQWEKLFEENGVKALLAVVLVLQLAAEQRAGFTLRRLIHDDLPAAMVEWALGWETLLHGRELVEQMREARPVATPGIEVTARHVLRNGELAAEDFRLSLKRPFEVDWRVQPWMPLLLPRCDGNRSVNELFEECRETGWIAAQTPLPEFCGLIGNLVSGGFLQLPRFRWPGGAG
jgi:SAM-dependent methyltransferase